MFITARWREAFRLDLDSVRPEREKKRMRTQARKIGTVTALGLVLGLAGLQTGQAGPPTLSDPNLLPDLVERVMPGVVNISSTTITQVRRMPGWELFMEQWGVPSERKQTSLGSGFILDHEGYIFTNNHVVDDADEVIVTLNDKRQLPAKIVGKDEKTDLALLKIRDMDQSRPSYSPGKGPVSPASGLSPVPMGNSDQVRIAETVFAVGNPFGLNHTVTTGIISAKNRTIGMGPFDNFLQTDASINPGNSGGPLFNLKGEVIGINTLIYSRTGQSGGVGFAIPSNEAKALLGDLKRYGRVPRPWLGILGERVTPNLARYYQLGSDRGVLIYNMVQRAPAVRAGLERGDVIVAIDGQKVEELFEIERVLARKRPNDSVSLTVSRGRRSIEAKLKLEELPRSSNLPQGIL